MHIGGSEAVTYKWSDVQVYFGRMIWLSLLPPKITDWRAVGLKLGLSEDDLDMCVIECPHEEQALEMLCLWQEKQFLISDTSKTKLAQVLKELAEFEALD